jgi:hypothetical protein
MSSLSKNVNTTAGQVEEEEVGGMAVISDKYVWFCSYNFVYCTQLLAVISCT